MDVRAFGKGFEEFYDRVRREGVRYVRGNPSEIYKRGDKLVVRAEDTLTATPLEHETDMVVLSVGLMPRRDDREMIDLLKLSQTSDRFYLEAHPKLRPVDTASDGVYLAGVCQGPKDIPDAVAQAKGAASAAMILMASGKVKVEAQISVVDESTCRGCGFCVEICPYTAIELVEVNRMGWHRQGGPGQRGPLQGLRSLRGGLPLRFHPAALLPGFPDPAPDRSIGGE